MIDSAQSEKQAKFKREKSREAIALALKGNWERATEVNKDILRLFPQDVDALNRLGKAFLELGRYAAAREGFENATRIAPHNTIAKKNLERLGHLQETTSPPKQGKVVTPYLFIEESGKSGVTVLQNPAPGHVLAKMAAGDPVRLESRDHAIIVENNQGEHLGQIEPKLGMRLMRLIKGGNRYDAAIISMNRQEISIIISETHRHPDLGNICSFPTRSKEDYNVYWQDARLRYDIDSELEDDQDVASDWRGSYADGSGLTDTEEPAESMYPGKVGREVQDADEE